MTEKKRIRSNYLGEGISPDRAALPFGHQAKCSCGWCGKEHTTEPLDAHQISRDIDKITTYKTLTTTENQAHNEYYDHIRELMGESKKENQKLDQSQHKLNVVVLQKSS